MSSKRNHSPKQAPTVRKFGAVGTYIEKVDTIEHLSNTLEGNRLKQIERRINELATAVGSDDRLADAAEAVAEQLALASRALSRHDTPACRSALQQTMMLVGDERSFREAASDIIAELEAPRQ